MSTPEDRPRSDVTPPQADERLAGDAHQSSRGKEGQKGEGASRGFAGRLAGLASSLGVRSGTRGLTILAVMGACLLLVIGGTWNWLVNRHPQGLPVIGPPPYAVKDRPADPGGMMIMGDDTTKSDVSGRGAVHLAPPPEQPDAGLLAGRMAASSAVDTHRDKAEDGSSHEGRANEGHAREERADEDHAHEGRAGDGSQPVETTHQADARRDEEKERRKTPSSSGGEVTQQPLAHPAPLPPPLSSGEAQRERRDAERRNDGAGDRQAASGAGSANGLATAAPAGSSTSSSGEAGHYEVQLAALQNEEQARQEWEHLRHKLPDLLGGHEPVLRKVERGGKSFVRLRVGGFADRMAARQLCVQLHAQAQACSVAAN